MTTRKKLSLLVLEDSSTQAKVISRMFSDEGVDVTVVSSARELTSSPHLFDIEVQAALIDVHFGDVNGLKLIEPLLRRWPGIALVLMTANDTNDFEVLAEARELGAHLVLKKPFARHDVIDVLQDIDAICKTGSRREHVVVIDDSRTTRSIVEKLLRSFGFRVSMFENGEEAIRQLNYDHVDVVLTDMHMPGMSGQELICLIRDIWKNVGIVAMSTDASVMRGKKGPDAFVQKPFGPEEMKKAIKNAIKADVSPEIDWGDTSPPTKADNALVLDC